MNEAAIAARANVVASVFQPFVPQGVTGVVVVEESHLSIHTWPECGYAAVDFYTCGEAMPELAHEVICAGLRAQYSELMHVERGYAVPGRGIQLRSHYTEFNEWPSELEETAERAGSGAPTSSKEAKRRVEARDVGQDTTTAARFAS